MTAEYRTLKDIPTNLVRRRKQRFATLNELVKKVSWADHYAQTTVRQHIRDIEGGLWYRIRNLDAPNPQKPDTQLVDEWAERIQEYFSLIHVPQQEQDMIARLAQQEQPALKLNAYK